MKSKIDKTNAMRILDSNEFIYQAHVYNISDGLINGKAVCQKIGANADEFYKTLVAHGTSKRICVFVIPVASELDLKKAAFLAGEKSIEMLHVKDLLSFTGYIRGGCSPIGMKKQYDTFYDDSIKKLSKIYVSGGKKGLVISLSPNDLVIVTQGIIGAIVRN